MVKYAKISSPNTQKNHRGNGEGRGVKWAWGGERGSASQACLSFLGSADRSWERRW